LQNLKAAASDFHATAAAQFKLLKFKMMFRAFVVGFSQQAVITVKSLIRL